MEHTSLRSALRSTDPKKRAEAVAALAAKGAWDALAAALDDPDLSVRLKVVRALAQSEDEKAAVGLAKAAAHADLVVRDEAMRALAAFAGAGRERVLVALTRASDARVRREALESLARGRPDEYVDLLKAALDDRVAPVRLAAVRLLAPLDDAAALALLLPMLDDVDAAVRDAARERLERVSVALRDFVAAAGVTKAGRDYVRARLDREPVDALARELWQAGPLADAEILRSIAARDVDVLRPYLSGGENERAAAAVDAVLAIASEGTLAALMADWGWNETVRQRLVERAVGTKGAWADECLRRAASENQLALQEAVLRGLSVPREMLDRAFAAWDDGTRAKMLRFAPPEIAEPYATHRTPALRRGAVEGLARAKACDALAKLGETGDLVVLKWVALTLADAKDARALLPLVRAAEEGKGDLNRRAKKHLAGWRIEFDELLGWMAHPRASLRRFAAERLGRSGDGRAVAPLLGAMDDAVPEVQYAAVLALKGFCDREEVADRLIACLGYGDVGVRQAAVEALGEGRVVKAVPALTKALGNTFLKQRAAEALRRIGDRQGMLAVLRRRRREENIAKEREKVARLNERRTRNAEGRTRRK